MVTQNDNSARGVETVIKVLPKDFPEIVCLCGSSRFIESFAVLAWEFEKQGRIALGLHLLPASYPTKVADHIAEAEGVTDILNNLHLRKIDLADAVFIVNVGGYIGNDTRREIAYAEKLRKPIAYLEQPIEGSPTTPPTSEAIEP